MAYGEHVKKNLSGTGYLWKVEKMYMRTQDVGSWKQRTDANVGVLCLKNKCMTDSRREMVW